MVATPEPSYKRVVALKQPEPPPQYPLSPQEYSESVPSSAAIVIDLGSSTLRAGFSSDLDLDTYADCNQSQPYFGKPGFLDIVCKGDLTDKYILNIPRLQYPPIASRLKDKRRRSYDGTYSTSDFNRFARNPIGYDALQSSTRSAARSAFEANIPVNPYVLERLLDGTMQRLGLAEVDSDSISHPFVISEVPAIPNDCRAVLNEVLFEGYGAQKIAYGIDAAFAYLYHSWFQSGSKRYQSDHALLVSLGHTASHVIPIVNGTIGHANMKRVSVGGSHMTTSIQKRLQLLYPKHSTYFSTGAIETLKHDVCYVPLDYEKEIEMLRDMPDYFDQIATLVRTSGLSEQAVLAAREKEIQKAQRRTEQGKKLKDFMQAKRKQQEDQLESDLNESESGPDKSTSIQKQQAKSGASASSRKKKSAIEAQAVEMLFTSEEKAEYEKRIAQRDKLKAIADIRDASEDVFNKKITKLGYPGVDDFLNEYNASKDSILQLYTEFGQEKFEAIVADIERVKAENELLAIPDKELDPLRLTEKRRIRSTRAAAEARKRMLKDREEAARIREEKEAEILKRKTEDPEGYLQSLKTERYEILRNMKRRKNARESGSDRRSQASRNRISLLAQQGENLNPTLKKKNDKEALFGAKDSDWDVYREMQGTDSEAEAEEVKTLERLEVEIKSLDPDFFEREKKSVRGAQRLYLDENEEDLIEMTVDRIRGCELIWQPSLLGIETCGIGDAASAVVQTYENNLAIRNALVSNVILMGGSSLIHGMKERLLASLEGSLLVTSPPGCVKITRVSDPILDPWRGAALFAHLASEIGAGNVFIQRQDYEEKGSDYLQEHFTSNIYIPTPKIDKSHTKDKRKRKK